jgi:hypothetical protein
MSYNVNYTNLPTFQQNSIGYNQIISSYFVVPSNTPFATILNITSFTLKKGVYILSLDTWAATTVTAGFTYCYSSSSSTWGQQIVFPAYSIPHNSDYISSSGSSNVINQTTDSTIYINVQLLGNPQTTAYNIYYNASIIRIA